MSRFLSKRLTKLTPYVPGEQPIERTYLKLNTNESPYCVDENVAKAVNLQTENIQLYPDPQCRLLRKQLAQTFNISEDEVMVTDGSDEALSFAMLTFCDDETKVVFPDITYGFYKVLANIYNLDYKQLPLNDNFEINLADYNLDKATIFIPNPNAPTGIALSLNQIEDLLKSNPDNIVVIDEAYVDFGASSAVSLINKYDNLLVVQTFSKAYSFAGGRIGLVFANKELINELNAVRNSINPYGLNRFSYYGAIEILKKRDYYMANCAKVMATRSYTTKALKAMDFEVLPSLTNFVLAKSNRISGSALYEKLKEKGILVRHFNDERIKDYNRITIGSQNQMEQFIDTLKQIMEEN